MSDPDYPPPAGVDISRPSVARMYDFYLHGKDNFQADRDAVAQVEAAMPEVRQLAQVILSFRVSRVCDLRCPVVDGVADGTLAV